MKKKGTERRSHWQRVVAEQEASGKTIRVFCREQNLREQAFYGWRRRLREEQPVSFALVEAKEAIRPAAKFELALSGGEVLQIPAEVESLRMVFEALRAER